MTMSLFRRPGRSADPLWQVASKTPTFTADEATVTGLAQGLGSPRNDTPIDGCLVARRHPTGWFVHAVHRDTLSPDQIPIFGELVTVRCYLLLAHGPQAPAWRPAPVEGEWRSPAFAVAEALKEFDNLQVDREGPTTP